MDAKMKNITIVALTFAYTIFIVLLYGKTFTSQYLETYTNFVTICASIFAFALFYFSGTSNFLTNQQLGLEKIKTAVLFLCFNTLVWAYHFYFENISSYSTILTGLISLVSFLYTTLILSLKGNNIERNHSKSKPLLFGTLAAGVSSLFMVLEATNVISWTYASLPILIVGCLVALTLFVSLLIAFIVGPNLYTGVSLETANTASDTRKLFAKLLGILSGLTIFPVLVVWLGSWVPSWLKSIFKAPYKLISQHWTVVKIFLLCGTAVVLKKYLGKSSTGVATTGKIVSNKVIETSQNVGTIGTIIGSALFFSIAVLPLIKYAQSVISGGKKLVGNTAHPLNKQVQIATYDNISSNGSDKIVPQSYAYGLSFWFYVNSMAPNTSTSYSKFVSVLNHGNRPNILYKGNTNTLMITMRNDYDGKLLPSELSPLNNNERIIYTHKNILMQRWNHVAVNYSFGTIDVFINGELVKSIPGVVPFNIPDNTTIGEDGGLYGGIRNVVYFDKPMTTANLNQLYTNV
jgi:hypothetical protein